VERNVEYAYIDASGSIKLPALMAPSLYKTIVPAVYDDFRILGVPCDTKTTVEFQIGEYTYTLIPGSGSPSPPTTPAGGSLLPGARSEYSSKTLRSYPSVIFLGKHFMRSVYTVLDIEKREVGHAKSRFGESSGSIGSPGDRRQDCRGLDWSLAQRLDQRLDLSFQDFERHVHRPLLLAIIDLAPAAMLV
jgi:hypothetical protein